VEELEELKNSSCPVGWGPPPGPSLDELVEVPPEIVQPIMRELGIRVPTYHPAGLRLVAVVVPGRSEDDALSVVGQALRHGDPSLFILQFAFGGRNLSTYYPYPTLLRRGPDATVTVREGGLYLGGGINGSTQGCPFVIHREYAGEVGCRGNPPVVDLIPAHAEIQIGDWTYEVYAYLPTDELIEFMGSMVPPEGCREHALRPKPVRVGGTEIPLDSLREFDPRLRVPSWLPDNLTLVGALIPENSWNNSLLLVFSNYSGGAPREVGYYNVPAPWLPDGPLLVVWVDRLEEGAFVFPEGVREVEVSGLRVYVWPEVPDNPIKISAWIDGLLYTVQGYYPLDDLLRVVESIEG